MLELFFRYIGRVVLKNGTQRRVFTHIVFHGGAGRYRPPKPACGAQSALGNEDVVFLSILHLVGHASKYSGSGPLNGLVFGVNYSTVCVRQDGA